MEVLGVGGLGSWFFFGECFLLVKIKRVCIRVKEIFFVIFNYLNFYKFRNYL